MSVKSIWSKLSFKTCVSILIFCLDDQSTDISGVLKFPTITVLLLIFFFYGIPTYSIPYQLHLPVLNFMQMNLCSVPAFWNSWAPHDVFKIHLYVSEVAVVHPFLCCPVWPCMNVHVLPLHSSEMCVCAVSSWGLLWTHFWQGVFLSCYPRRVRTQEGGTQRRDSQARPQGLKGRCTSPFLSSLCTKPSKATNTASKIDEFSRFYCKIELKSQGVGNFPLNIYNICSLSTCWGPCQVHGPAETWDMEGGHGVIGHTPCS